MKRCFLLASALAAMVLPVASGRGRQHLSGFCNIRSTWTGIRAARFNQRPSYQASHDGQLTLGVYVHVLARPEETQNRVSEYLLSHNDVAQQIEVLNRGFEAAKIAFRLQGVDWTTGVFSTYEFPFYGVMTHDRLRGLYKGDHSTLNIYFLNATDHHGGIASTQFSKEHIHGVWLNSNTVLGGSNPYWNLGKVAIHEVGHWLGFDDHTAVNECYKPDASCDTRPECINHMSDATDQCRTEFDWEQIEFMRYFAEQLQLGRTPKYYHELEPQYVTVDSAPVDDTELQEDEVDFGEAPERIDPFAEMDTNCGPSGASGVTAFGVSVKECREKMTQCIQELGRTAVYDTELTHCANVKLFGI